MDFSDLIKQRVSIREYKPDPVEKEKLELLFQAACMAPSAMNRHPYKFYAISTRGREDELKRIYNSDWFVTPPWVIGLCLIEDLAWKRQDGCSYAEADAAIAFDYLVLMAANLGLGTCWLASFDPEAAREILHLPDNQMPFLFTPLGYPLEITPPRRRKQIENLVEWME